MADQALILGVFIVEPFDHSVLYLADPPQVGKVLLAHITIRGQFSHPIVILDLGMRGNLLYQGGFPHD
jgi:hypothetical protein